MSYNTTTIANRLKITKGWKSSLFPTKKWDYSRETVFWFKLYLFLKAYLALKRIQLLFCEIRMAENNTYLLYLSVNKIKRKKKRYWRKALLLKRFKSSLNRHVAKKAKHLLYGPHLALLKQTSFWKYNSPRQKILPKVWISKPRLRSWINLIQIIKTQRQRFKIYQKIKQTNKKFQSNLWRSFTFLASKKNSEKKYLQIFFTLKEKKLLSIFLRLQKNTLLLQKYLFFFLGQEGNIKKNIFLLQKQIKRQTNLAKQVYKLYLSFSAQRCQNIHLKNSLVDQNLLTKKHVESTRKKRALQKWKYSWKITKKRLNVFIIKTFVKGLPKKKRRRKWKKKKEARKAIQLHSLFHTRTFFYNFFVPRKNYFWKIVFESYFLSLKKKKVNPLIHLLLKKNMRNKIPNFQQRISRSVLKKKLRPKKLFIFQGIRFRQKSILKDVAAPRKEKFKYRFPFRRNYIQNLRFSVNYKIKQWLRHIIYEYFSVHFCIKFLWPLPQFKNLKFYRIAFPAKKEKKKQKQRWKKEDTSWLKKYPANISWQNYVYLAKMAKYSTQKAIKDKRNSLGFIRKKFMKKRPFFLDKLVKKENKKKSRIMPLAHSFFMRNLIPTLTLFTKYLDPQLLADTIAKIIQRARKQSWFLYDLRQILRSLFLESIAGYKIVLIGRINGRNKTGLLTIKNAKEANAQQTWLKQVSFGMAQAKGRIGTFGIKIWIYH